MLIPPTSQFVPNFAPAGADKDWELCRPKDRARHINQGMGRESFTDITRKRKMEYKNSAIRLPNGGCRRLPTGPIRSPRGVVAGRAAIRGDSCGRFANPKSGRLRHANGGVSIPSPFATLGKGVHYRTRLSGRLPTGHCRVASGPPAPIGWRPAECGTFRHIGCSSAQSSFPDQSVENFEESLCPPIRSVSPRTS